MLCATLATAAALLRGFGSSTFTFEVFFAMSLLLFAAALSRDGATSQGSVQEKSQGHLRPSSVFAALTVSRDRALPWGGSRPGSGDAKSWKSRGNVCTAI